MIRGIDRVEEWRFHVLATQLLGILVDLRIGIASIGVPPRWHLLNGNILLVSSVHTFNIHLLTGAFMVLIIRHPRVIDFCPYSFTSYKTGGQACKS